MPHRPFATSIVKKLQDKGHVAYFAGGWVRDYLLQHPSDDIDIATSASVEQIQHLFPKTIPVGISFGIVIVVEEGHHFEVATFRKESGYEDGRRPTKIEPTSSYEDAQRRDFTINGMFFDPIKEELLDFVGGKEDLEKGVIRAIGNPKERFLEDRLRMMRAVRYSTRFSFPIEEKTLSAIVSESTSLFPSVAIERIWQEFKKMSQFAHFDRGLLLLHRLNLLPTIFPELKGISEEEIEKRISVLSYYPKQAPTIAELIELFPAYSLQDALLLCERLKLSRQEKEMVQFLNEAKEILTVAKEKQTSLEPVQWAHFYAHPASLLSQQIFAAHLKEEERKPFLLEHKRRMHELNQAILRIQSKQPLIQANHLMQEGIVPGQKMGRLLKEAERISINHHLENREEIIYFLKKSPLWDSN